MIRLTGLKNGRCGYYRKKWGVIQRLLYAHHKKESFDTYDFIDITSKDNNEKHLKLKQDWIDSEEFKSLKIHPSRMQNSNKD